MPWDEVAQVRSDKRLYLVLLDGKTIQGTPVISQDKIEPAETRTTFARDSILTIRNEEEQAA